MKNSIILLSVFICSLAIAQEDKAKKETGPIPEAEVSTTQMSVRINGTNIPLTARAGTLQLRSETNEPIALFGFTYYSKDGGGPNRPIMFAYNGGPGSSSFWLHMGVMGPRRIVVKDPDFTPAAPYQIVNNDYSILDVADLVMMDPVGTGLSVAIGKAKFEDFWGVDQDARSISLFIRQFLIEHGRMNSPKFLLGESYGTFRNAAVMNRLLNQGIALNGVIMVSAVFDLRTLLFPPNDDMPYLVHFPTYAATAWYHNKLANKAPNLETFLNEVRAFTRDEYAPALYKGDQLSDADRKGLAAKLVRFAGLTEDYWMRADLRVQAGEYFQELLRGDGNTVGRLDSRYKGTNQDLISQFADYDPQSLAISPAYISGFLHYFYNDLKVSKKHTYTTSAGSREGFRWDWKHEGNMRWGTSAAIHTGIDLAEALSHDPNMKVLIMNGIYDLATPFYGVEYTIDHLGLTKEAKKNIIMKYYEAGHMMYTHQPSIEKFKKDLAEFVTTTAK
ncbi:MAG: S10 family peptidase [Cyclobacteriaceae bacterium]